MLIVDVETSGLDPKLSSIVSIGAVNFEDQSIEFSDECRIFDGAQILDGAPQVNGISEDEMRNPQKQSEAELIKKFSRWIAEQNAILQKTHGYKHVIAGQFISFDISFIKAACERAGIEYMFNRRFVDLHSIVYAEMVAKGDKLPTKESGDVNLSLDEALKYLGFEPEPKPHIAITGARLATKAFNKLIFGGKTGSIGK